MEVDGEVDLRGTVRLKGKMFAFLEVLKCRRRRRSGALIDGRGMREVKTC